MSVLGDFFREAPERDPLSEAQGILVGAVLGAMAWAGPVLVYLLVVRR